MALYFVDTRGREGWIGNDLSLEHSGGDAVAESIVRLIDEFESDCENAERVHDMLMIELPQECEVRSIERTSVEPENAWESVVGTPGRPDTRADPTP